MTFSLITATLGRVDEVRILCESLSKQTFKDFELYIVDQNEHHLLEGIVKQFSDKIQIHYIRNEKKGLSLNRNIALKIAKGDFFGFPDDDCYYSSNTLEEVYRTFQENPNASFVATTTYDSKSKQIQRTTQKKKIQKKDILETCISYNMFVKKNPALFDECLGVGTYFSSGEETDYLYSQIHKKNDFGIFCSTTSIFHPKNTTSNKVYNYSLGFAALQKKDWLVRHNPEALRIYFYYVIRAIGGMLLLKNFQNHWNSLKGKIVGFIKFKV